MNFQTIVYGEVKTKPLIIRNYAALISEILICSCCKEPVYKGYGKYYSCEKCQALTADVEWKKQELTA